MTDTRRWSNLPVLAAAMLIVAACGGALTWMGPRTSADSASYLECARSLLAGRGFVAGVFDGLETDRWRAMTLWPPGYPLLTAALMTSGLAASTAALALAWASGLAALGLAAWWFFSRFEHRIAAPLLLIFAAMSGLHRYVSMCWADGPYLALTLASLLLAGRSIRTEPRGLLLAAASGLLAGFAWTVRNAGLSLLGSIGLYLLARVVYAPQPRREVARLAAWVTGCAAGGGWLVAHNLIVFGRLSPYSMGPSDLGLVHNTLFTAWVVVRDLLVLPQVGRLHEGLALAIGAAALLVAAALAVGAARGVTGRWSAWIADAVTSHGDAVMASLYVLSYAAVIIVARSTYRWGEPISERYLLQVYPAVLFLVGCVVSVRAGRQRWIATLYAVLVLQLAWDAVQVGYYWKQSGLRMDARAVADRLRSDAGPDAMVLSDAYNILRGHGELNARAVTDDPGDVKRYPPDAVVARCASGTLWGIAIQHAGTAREGRYGPVIQRLVVDPASMGFTRRAGFGDWMVASCAGANAFGAHQPAAPAGAAQIGGRPSP